MLAAQRDDEDVQPGRVRQTPHPGAQLDGEQLRGQRLAGHLDEVRRPQPRQQFLVRAGAVGHGAQLVRRHEHVLADHVGEDHAIGIEPVEPQWQQLPAVRRERCRRTLQSDHVVSPSSTRPVRENASANTRFRSGSVSFAIRARRI